MTRELLGGEWLAWLDEAAAWLDVDPVDPVASLGRAPSGGWSSLERGVSLRLPASTVDVAPDYHGVSWWSTEVRLEPGPAQTRLLFGGVRLLAEVFWDRRSIGWDLEGMTPFAVDIPPELCTPGVHRLDVRVTNPGGSRTWDDIRPVRWGRVQLPASHDFGGPWQPAMVHRSGVARIDDVWVRPGPALDHAIVDVEISGPKAVTLSIAVNDPSGSTVAAAESVVGPGSSRHELLVPDAVRYGPGSPALYTCRVSVDGDEHVEAFGFRSLDAIDGELLLNGASFRLMGAISWGHYRRGPVPSPGDVDREAESLEAFGFNTLSAHRSPATPELCDALERRGLFLYQEPGTVGGPMFASCDAEQRPHVEQLSFHRIRRLARRDRSRACLVWWNLANEWTAGDKAGWPTYVDGALEALRSTDDSRLTTFTSGWGEIPLRRPFDPAPDTSWDYHRVFTWPNAWHEAVETEIALPAPPRPMLTIDGESACFASLGELPRTAADVPPDLPAGAPERLWAEFVDAISTGLKAADPSDRLGGIDGFCAGTAAVQMHGVARLIDGHRRHGFHGLMVNGWHQHPRVGSTGIVTPDRRPAGDPGPVRRANAPRALALPRLQRCGRLGDEVSVTVELLSDGRSPESVTADLVLEGPDGVVWSGAPGRVPLPAAGLLTLRARWQDLEVDDAILVLHPPSAPTKEVVVVDAYDELTPWLSRHGVATRAPGNGPEPALFVGGTVLGHLEIARRRPPRVAVIDRRLAHGHMPVTLDTVAGGSAFTPPRVPMQGSWTGGWAFTVDDALPGLGPAGVWGAERVPLFPAYGVPDPGGRWLAGMCSFPDADLWETGVPAFGATAWITRDDAGEILYTVLPVIEQRDGPLGETLLLGLLHWLCRA